jgi:hypothetical protein
MSPDENNNSLRATKSIALQSKAALHIPPEILQTIFRNLTFFDLLRCQQVNKTWSSYLPGNDPFLARTLFTSARKVVKSNPSNPPCLLLKPLIETFLLSPADDDLPSLCFTMCLKDGFTLINMPRRVVFHPIMTGISRNMPFVSDAFEWPEDFDVQLKDEMNPWMQFFTLRELEREVSVRKSIEEDGNWKDHLLCIPAIDCVEVTWRWYKNIHVGGEDVTRSLRTRKMKRGITVGAFVEVMRDLLSYAVADVKRFADKLECRTCDRCRDDDYDDETEEEFESSDDGEECSEGEEISEDEDEDESEDEEAEDKYECDCGHCTCSSSSAGEE